MKPDSLGDPSDPLHDVIYATRIAPHRSLRPVAFKFFIFALCVASGLASTPFLMMGAWPVAGFIVLDALALYLALMLNYRAARAYETLDLTALELVVAQVSQTGERCEKRFNPSWVKLEEDRREEVGTQRVALVSRGERLEIGEFLGPEQKHALAMELARALAKARRGPVFG